MEFRILVPLGLDCGLLGPPGMDFGLLVALWLDLALLGPSGACLERLAR